MKFIYSIISVLWLPSIAGAELPALEKDRVWKDCFAVHEGQRYDFCLQAKGEMWLIPKQRDRDPVALANRIRIHYGIEEVFPDGHTVLKEVYALTLESAQPASRQIRRLVVTGQCTGEARFEMIVEQSRDMVSLGGRVLDAGKLKANPLRFTYRLMMPNVYRAVEIEGRKDQRDFDKRTRGDYLEVLRLDGSRLKLETDEARALKDTDLCKAAVESMEMRLSYYEGRRFFFQSTSESGLVLSDGGHPKPWYEGFVAQWWSDAESDPETKARLSFGVK